MFWSQPRQLHHHPICHSHQCLQWSGAQRPKILSSLFYVDIQPHHDLDIMKKGQDLTDITTVILTRLKEVILEENPDVVFVHGDTTTTLAASLAAFYQKIPVGHVEAGLRTGDLYSPWPEECNRKLTASIAKYHLAPTNWSKQNLLNEGIDSTAIKVTGNTVIDALLWVSRKLDTDDVLKGEVNKKLPVLNPNKRMILVTGHRRENFGDCFDNICHAFHDIVQ